MNVFMHDEFYRFMPAVGPFTVTLTANDRTLHFVMPKNDSVATFNDLPYQVYLVSVDCDGFFQGTSSTTYSYEYKSMQVPIFLFPVPSPLTRVDSIRTELNTVLPEVKFRIFTAQTVPLDGYRYLVVFAGLTPYVGPEYGSYVFTFDRITETPGTSEVTTQDLYREMLDAGISTGSHVYVTARITPGATIRSVDAATGLTLYRNLENNTHAVTSFSMP